MVAGTHDDEFAPTERLVTQGGGAAADGETLAPGARIGDYRIEALLGRGGMGEVYRAEQLQPVHRTVALKLLHRHRLEPKQLAYFEVERQVLAQMQHPAIAQIFDAGTTPDGTPYFAMEYIEGRAVTQYCVDTGLALRARLELFVRICEGVQHAHQKGIIHRDLKPANMLVAEVDGRPLPKIIDFGIATAASRTFAAGGEIAGTPAYMSPEQAGRTPYEVDIRSDVYSLGVVLYELLAGVRPDAATSEPDTERTTIRPPSRALDTLPDAQVEALARMQGLSGAQYRSRLRHDLDWIVMRAIRSERDERYASAAALAEDIRRYLGDKPVHAAPGGRAYVARKFVRRHRLALAAGAMVLLALLAGLALSLYGLWQAEAQRILAEARSRELEQVAAFQQSMLEGIDIEAMGKGLIAQQRRQVEPLLAAPDAPAVTLEQWDALAARISPTDLARNLLDEHVLTRALSTLDRDFASQPRLDADLREAVARVYVALGAYARAAVLLPAVAEVRTREQGGDDPATIRTRIELGHALNRGGKLPEARALQQSLREQAARLPALDPALRDRIDLDYALTLGDQGELAQAIEVQQALLDRIVARDGEGGEESLKVRNNLAISLMRVGRFDEGRSQFESLLQQRRELLGAEHTDTVATMGNLAAARGMSGDPEGALELQREVYAINRRQLGEDHPATLGARSNLGSSLNGLGRDEEAYPHLAYVLEGRRRVLGAEHPMTLRAMLNLGSVLSRMDRQDEALALQKEAYDARRRVLGPEHPDTLGSAMNVATSLRDVGRARDGLPLAQQVLEIRERVLGPLHPETTETRMGLASVAWEAGERTLAFATLEPVMTQEGVGERQRLRSAARLYALYRGAGRKADAEALKVRLLDPLLQRDVATLSTQERSTLQDVQARMAEELD
jgi:hypothetical protein